jgi:hypothetical protein
VPEPQIGVHRPSGLVDVLDRILEKGLVVAGDVKVSLAEVELLTIRIRLIVCSIDKAVAIGLDWWRADRYFSAGDGRTALPASAPSASSRMRPSARGLRTPRSQRRPNRSTTDRPGRRRGGE